MVVDFAEGREHIRNIGSEQGGIPAWDDLVVEHHDLTLEYIQIKRNFTKFSDDGCDRDADPANKGKTNQHLKALSPLDESMLSLASWTGVNDPAIAPKRKFTIELPGMGVSIKKELEVRHFYDFCYKIKPSTTAAALQASMSTDPAANRLFLWLKTWCGFADWDHMLKALRHLTVKQVGVEVSIDERTDSLLARCFQPASEVRDKIKYFVTENSTYTSVISPRQLMGELKRFWRPNLQVWTQYINNTLNWEISGISDPDFGEVERAVHVVNTTWDNGRKSEVMIKCDSSKHEPLPSALRRMVLHIESNTSAYIHNSGVWKERALSLIGNTLGKDDEDCSCLHIIDGSTMHASSEFRPIPNTTIAQAEGNSLDAQMDEESWLLVKRKLTTEINNLPSGDLKVAIEARWAAWMPKLESDAATRSALCRQMLHPIAEGSHVAASIRYGPKTATLIVKGLFLMLAVATAVSATDEGWTQISKSYTVEAKALVFWSGPADGDRSVKKIADGDISVLYGKEVSDVLILSGVESGNTETKQVSLGEGKTTSGTLADGHQPRIIITYSRKLKSALHAGNLASLKSAVNQLFATTKATKTQQINEIMK